MTAEVVPLVSFAQHGEDIVLNRAFAHQTDGWYVDVGAFDPTVDSVTRMFYDRGWRGVNIEPSSEAIDRFRLERPDDVNLAVAAGALDGEITFFVSDVPGWSTTDTRSADALSRGGHVAQRMTVPVRRLSSILDELPERPVDFLKVDVEGGEVAVLEGLDLTRHRPRVVILEAVAPGAVADHVGEALSRLTDAGYLLGAFDGLNHYLTCEPDLLSDLSSPANPTDRYVKFSVLQAERRAAWLEKVLAGHQSELAKLPALQAKLPALQAELAGLQATLAERDEQLSLVLASRSWRITAPLRAVAGVRQESGALSSVPARLERWLQAHPGVRRRLVAVALRSPALELALRRRRRAWRARPADGPRFDVVSRRRRAAIAALVQGAAARGSST